MAEMVLQVRTLPEPLFRLIHTEKVKVREHKGEIHLLPIEEPADNHAVDRRSILPILGMYSDGKLTVDSYLKQKRADKELEQ